MAEEGQSRRRRAPAAAIGAEAGERASVSMASSWASAESAGARGKRLAGPPTEGKMQGLQGRLHL